MDVDLDLINRKAILFMLGQVKWRNPAIAEMYTLFDRHIKGEEVSVEEWEARMGDLICLLQTAAMDNDNDSQLDNYSALRFARYAPGYIHVAYHSLWEITKTELIQPLAAYIVLLLGKQAPYIPDVRERILARVDDLDMDVWHGDCDTVHCLAGFAESFAGDMGLRLYDAFGHELAGAIIFEKSIGDIPDFHCDKKGAIEWLRAKKKNY